MEEAKGSGGPLLYLVDTKEEKRKKEKNAEMMVIN